MRDLYATSLQIVHIAGGNAFDVACDRTLGWAWRVQGDPPDLDLQPNGANVDANGTTVRWNSVTARSVRAVQVELEHPDSKDSSNRWKTSVAISEYGGSTKVTIRLGLEATVYALKPVSISMRAPQLAVGLMQAPLLAYAGDIELRGNPRIISEGDAEGLVSDELEAAGRALPVLIASSGVDRQLTASLARGLAGLAQIVRSADPATDALLDNYLRGSGLTVPRGGLRLFWPGFGTVDQPSRHPYWTHSQLRTRNAEKSVVDQLARILGPISTARVPNDPAFLRARQEALREEAEIRRTRDEANRQRARRQRESARVALARAAESAGAEGRYKRQAESLTEVEALLDLSERERESAEERAKVAQEKESEAISEALGYLDRVDNLEAENRVLTENLKAMSTFQASGEEGDDQVDPLPESVSSWEELSENLAKL